MKLDKITRESRLCGCRLNQQHSPMLSFTWNDREFLSRCTVPAEGRRSVEKCFGRECEVGRKSISISAVTPWDGNTRRRAIGGLRTPASLPPLRSQVKASGKARGASWARWTISVKGLKSLANWRTGDEETELAMGARPLSCPHCHGTLLRVHATDSFYTAIFHLSRLGFASIDHRAQCETQHSSPWHLTVQSYNKAIHFHNIYSFGAHLRNEIWLVCSFMCAPRDVAAAAGCCTHKQATRKEQRRRRYQCRRCRPKRRRARMREHRSVPAERRTPITASTVRWRLFHRAPQVFSYLLQLASLFVRRRDDVVAFDFLTPEYGERNAQLSNSPIRRSYRIYLTVRHGRAMLAIPLGTAATKNTHRHVTRSVTTTSTFSDWTCSVMLLDDVLVDVAALCNAPVEQWQVTRWRFLLPMRTPWALVKARRLECQC